MATNLVPSANEFVPGKFKPASLSVSTDIEEISASVPSLSGMNKAASVWVPTTIKNQNSSLPSNSNEYSEYAIGSTEEDGYYEDPSQLTGVIDDGTIEKMVEVNWNGSSFFVPETMTYPGEDGEPVYMGPVDTVTEEVDGLEWTNGSTTLPAPAKKCLKTIGLSEPIRIHFQQLDMEALRQMKPDDPRYKEIPIRYHSAYPLTDPSDIARGPTVGGGGSFGYPSSVYKVIDQSDSQIYALRRFDNVRITPSILSNALSMWNDIKHANIVQLHGVTADKGAIFFVYAYHSSAVTLKQKYVDTRGPMLSEALLWRLLVQLLSAVRVVHKRGIALRVVDIGKIIMTSGTIARFNCVGVPDVLEFECRKNIAELQCDDIVKLGRVALSLVTRAVITVANTEEALALCKQHYSVDLHRCIGAMLCGRNSINSICHSFSERFQDEYDTVMLNADALHSNLRTEYENSRIVRLLFKLGFINDRPEYELDPQWSETGDRYVLKLFRDFVFHQQAGLSAEQKGDDNTTPTDPVLDVGHVLTALNKLDVGDPEEILLSSRDGKDILVVSYADVQRCLESSFVELANQAHITLTTLKAHATANAAALSKAQQMQGGHSPYLSAMNANQSTHGQVTPGGTGSNGGVGGYGGHSPVPGQYGGGAGGMHSAHSSGNLAQSHSMRGGSHNNSNQNLSSMQHNQHGMYAPQAGYGGGRPPQLQHTSNTTASYQSASTLFVPPPQNPYGGGGGGGVAENYGASGNGSTGYASMNARAISMAAAASGGGGAGGINNPYAQQQQMYSGGNGGQAMYAGQLAYPSPTNAAAANRGGARTQQQAQW